jgi:ACS family tartrate transporter-like MFS transporter
MSLRLRVCRGSEFLHPSKPAQKVAYASICAIAANRIRLLTCVLVGAYSFKAPFWALSLEFLSPSTAAVGLAAINAIGSLIGGLMVNVYGKILERTGSTSLAMSPTAVMGIASALLVLMMARRHVCFDSPLSPDAPRA